MSMSVQEKAAVIWNSLNKSERHGIRFGLFPAKAMREAEAEGYDSRELCVALCDVAEKNGGMRA